MILHPHLKNFATAIEILHRFAAIMNVWGLQPKKVERFVEEQDEVSDRCRLGYIHELESDNSKLALVYSLYSSSEHSPIFVRIELYFADNEEFFGSKKIAIEYNCSLKEWVLHYEKNENQHVPLYESGLADSFTKKFNIKLGEHRLLQTIDAWEVVREMVEFYARLKSVEK